MPPLEVWLTHYGNAGLFVLLVLGIVGLPIPDETLLVISGYLISRGTFQPISTVLAAYLGSACGISVSYLLGRTVAHPLILRYGKYVLLTEARLQKTHDWFARTGEWFIAVGYFVPAIRHFTALVAGMSGLEFGKFAAFAYSGAALWIGTFLGTGYFVGENWPAIMSLVQRYTGLSVLSVAIVLILGVLMSRRRRKRQNLN